MMRPRPTVARLNNNPIAIASNSEPLPRKPNNTATPIVRGIMPSATTISTERKTFSHEVWNALAVSLQLIRFAHAASM